MRERERESESERARKRERGAKRGSEEVFLIFQRINLRAVRIITKQLTKTEEWRVMSSRKTLLSSRPSFLDTFLTSCIVDGVSSYSLFAFWPLLIYKSLALRY